MKKYKVRGTELGFLQEFEIEAENESDAEENYYEKWIKGELTVCDGDLEIVTEEADNG